jgi:hypothetical protein
VVVTAAAQVAPARISARAHNHVAVNARTRLAALAALHA